MVKARSSVVEHCFDVAGVSGSIPLAPTKKIVTGIIESEFLEFLI